MTGQLTKSVGAHSLLQRILETPEQVAAVQHLEAPVLARLIHHVGLEDAGELVALASTQQLSRIFDDDLWRSGRPGQEERFDAERFALWLEVMLEMGAEKAARTLAELDEDFVTFALSRSLLVLDMDALTLEQLRAREVRGSDESLLDKALESSLSHELDKYLLLGRQPEAWDAVLAVLVALDQEHHALLTRMLERLCFLSTEYLEDHGGLYAVLSAAEQLESDVAHEREQRREKQGHVAPQDAAGLLGLARLGRAGDDAVTRAHFRAQEAAAREATVRAPAAHPAASEAVTPLTRLLQEAEVLTPQAPVALLGAGEGSAQEGATRLLREGLVWLGGEDAGLLGRRMQELAYLSNVLLSGCSHAGRALRPLEAAQVAVAACGLGLELQLAAGEGRPGPVLAREGLVALFGQGWKLLYEEVVMWTARQLLEALSRRPEAGRGEVARALAALKRDVAAGRPWASRKQLQTLGLLLSREALEVVRGLMDECPSLGGQFVSSRAQVEAARARVTRVLGG